MQDLNMLHLHASESQYDINHPQQYRLELKNYMQKQLRTDQTIINIVTIKISINIREGTI